MKITTNISETELHHDTIKYPAIEKQVYDLFAVRFPDIKHESDRDGFYFILGGTRCSLEVGGGKKSKRTKLVNAVRLSIIPDYDPQNKIRFGEGDYPSVRLPYNEDVTDKVTKFCDAIVKVQDLEKRAQALFPLPDARKIDAFLNKELGTDKVQVTFWNENILSGIEVVWYLHPKGDAPANGILVCLEKATKKIVPFWNGSSERRRLVYGNGEGVLENALGRDCAKGVNAMKEKIKAVEELQAKVDSFDSTKSPDFMRLLDAQRQGDELLKEFNTLVKPKKKK